jgi:N-acetylglucosamine malate deacetylase 2
MKPPLVIIAAHPDDEVIGAGAHLFHWRDHVRFVHVTDGAPRNLQDAKAHGFANRARYAAARRAELNAALKLAGISPRQSSHLNIADQESWLHLVELTQLLLRHFEDLSPGAVLTHPYEGGHPDHDATAFGVHAACLLLSQKGVPAPSIFEMTSYHSRGGQMSSGEFLPDAEGPILSRQLTPEQQVLKHRLLGCFITQQKVLAGFNFQTESFRQAPIYDFTAPPHAGTLYYEQFDWGTTGAAWRARAAEALADLQIDDFRPKDVHNRTDPAGLGVLESNNLDRNPAGTVPRHAVLV